MSKTIKSWSKLPNIDFLKSQLEYIPTTGKLYWKIRSAYRVQVGSEAGTDDLTNKTKRIQISNEKGQRINAMAQVLAWTLYYEKYPTSRILFKDNDRFNLRIENLYLS